MPETRARFLSNLIGATSTDNDFTLPDTAVSGTDNKVLTSQGDGTVTWEETTVAPTITSLTYPTQNGVQATALAATGAQDDTAETLLINGQNLGGASVPPTVEIQVSGNYVPFAGTVTCNSNGTIVTCSSVTKRAAADGYNVRLTHGSNNLTALTNVNFSADPSFTTASDLGHIYEAQSLSKTIVATGDGTVSYSEGTTTLPSWITLTGATGALTGTAPSVSSTTQQNFDIIAQDSQNQTHTRNFTITTLDTNVSFGSLYSFAKALSTTSNQTTPTNKGTLTINSVSLGNYGYVKYGSDTTISSFSNSDWFAGTADTYSSWVIVDGNLTINSGQILRPSDRKLFTVLYVTGNLTVNGEISMTMRGANHSGTGNSVGSTTAGNIRIIDGTYGSYTNPTIPATGGTGASSWQHGTTRPTVGTTPNFGTGGGGNGGAAEQTGTASGGGGANGTSFTGGSAGGASYIANPDGNITISGGDAVANGGAGGTGNSGGYYGASGGAGNPAGSSQNGTYGSITSVTTGTGGVLVIFVKGTYSGSGSVSANGGPGNSGSGESYVSGEGSGGGMATVFCGTNSSGPSPTATAGNHGNNSSNPKSSGDGFTAIIAGTLP